MNPFQVVKDFEAALCEYTGAPYAVSTTSCTMALLLAVAWHVKNVALETRHWGVNTGLTFDTLPIEIPKYTYVGVPQAIIHAGGRNKFRDEDWRGAYQLKPLQVWDCARWFTQGLYGKVAVQIDHPDPQSGVVRNSGFVCVSFHASKTLADTQGGAILHDNPEADSWLRKARFDGRTEGVHPKNDKFDVLGWHAYISPDVASRLLWKMSALPKHNEPLPWGPGTNSDYGDLSQLEIFK